MSDSIRLLRNGWRDNYRYQGGLRAFARCWNGDRNLRRGRALAEPDPPPQVDCTVFSVVPQLSALWAVLFEQVVRVRPLRVLLGDCSGGFRKGTDVCSVTPMLNRHHGEKLDSFFAHMCRADVVLVTDDDIFWLDEEPLRWALDRLAADPQIAVVSLAPKLWLSDMLKGKVEKAMGSILVVRRALWMRERLSFQVVHPPPEEGINSFYDTGEFAQIELGRRGYRVEFGPDELRRHFVFFSGVSSWTLKMRKYKGEIGAAVEPLMARQEKALQTVHVSRGLARLYAERWPERHVVEIISPAILDRAQRICENLLEAEIVYKIRRTVEGSLSRIRQRLLDMDGDALDRLLIG